MTVTVTRSSWLPALGAIIAIPLLIMAVDLGLTYRIFPSPQEDDAGTLTTQGRSERRADIVWAAGLGVVGVVLAAGSLRELTNPRTIVSADEDGLRLDIGPRGSRLVTVPWTEVVSVKSKRVDDDFGRHPALVVETTSVEGMPIRVRGAHRAGNLMEVDAESWSLPVHEVADALNSMAQRVRRTAGEER